MVVPSDWQPAYDPLAFPLREDEELVANATVEDVVRWMVQEMQEHGYLYQRHAVYYICAKFGRRFAYVNRHGNPAIAKDVLAAFRSLTKNLVVWSRSERGWRNRMDADPPNCREVP